MKKLYYVLTLCAFICLLLSACESLLQSEYDDLQNEMEFLTGEYDLLQQENQELTDTIAALEGIVSSLELGIDDLSKENEDLHGKIAMLKDELEGFYDQYPPDQYGYQLTDSHTE